MVTLLIKKKSFLHYLCNLKFYTKFVRCLNKNILTLNFNYFISEPLKFRMYMVLFYFTIIGCTYFSLTNHNNYGNTWSRSFLSCPNVKKEKDATVFASTFSLAPFCATHDCSTYNKCWPIVGKRESPSHCDNSLFGSK